MKPEKLIIRNFGPFLGEESLDFTALEAIFLIMGKTGAGKTSIFDAMCFALYGQTPRSGKAAAFLTSDFNKCRDESSVTLYFSIRECRYKIYRTLFYTRKALRGAKDVEEDILTLEEIREDGDFALLSNGQNKSETERIIEKLIGLNAGQFMKIVLLPQGEFAEFLKQNTNERRTLLGKLFPMDEAKKIMQRAAEKAKTAELELKDLENRIAEFGRMYDVSEKDRLVQNSEAGLEAVKEKAAAVFQTEKELVELRGILKNAEEKQTVFHNAETEAGNAEKNLAKAKTQLDEAEREKQELPELTGRQNTMLKRHAVVAELAKAEAAIPSLEKNIHNYQKRKAEIASESAVLNNTLDNMRNDIAAHEKQAAGLAGLETEFDHARKDYDELVALKKMNEEKTKAAAEEKKAGDFIMRLSAEAGELSGHIAEIEQQIATLGEQIEKAKQNAAASELAKALIDGERCPVCGSEAHPFPAQIIRATEDLAKSKTAFEKMLAEKRDVLAQKNNDKAAMTEKGNAAKTRLLELTATEMEGRKKLSIDKAAIETAIDITEILKSRLDELNRLQKEKEGARRALGLVHGLQKELQETQNKLAAFDIEHSRIDAEEKNTRQKIAEIEEKKKALILEGQADGLSARDELAAIEAELARLETTIAAIREKDELAGKDFVAAKTRKENAWKNFDNAKKARDEAEAALLAVRHDRYPNWDAAEIERKLVEIAIEKETLERERDNAVAELARIKKDMESLKDAEAKREHLSRECGVLKALSDDLNGAGRAHAKISFDTWLLARHMDEIAAFASVRLNMMSEGRFHILLDEDGQKGGAGLKGLDLTIFDENTGTNRPCATLSGGETFLASISLAMGLADSVQSRAGGIKLDAVFIDEGFGSLDESTLEKALGIFDEISANRMVALISHVEELRTRIPSHVEVVKTKGGSHIRCGSGSGPGHGQ
ncbi:MAG: AAA family ATPase [Spirochaetaceae bacterium]|jgi:exonuclease SbcC|nr:AAA family ATPase [Spirochaetaceae bacterium]